MKTNSFRWKLSSLRKPWSKLSKYKKCQNHTISNHMKKTTGYLQHIILPSSGVLLQNSPERKHLQGYWSNQCHQPTYFGFPRLHREVSQPARPLVPCQGSSTPAQSSYSYLLEHICHTQFISKQLSYFWYSWKMIHNLAHTHDSQSTTSESYLRGSHIHRINSHSKWHTVQLQGNQSGTIRWLTLYHWPTKIDLDKSWKYVQEQYATRTTAVLRKWAQSDGADGTSWQ